MSTKISGNQNPLSDSQPTTSKDEYRGFFKLEKRILSFLGCSVPLENITQISNYPVKPVSTIPLLMVICSILLTIFCLMFLLTIPSYGSDSIKTAYGLGVLIFGFISGYGLWEMSRPYKFGITVELASGFRHYFIHKDKRFIDDAYNGFVKAIQNNKDFQVIFNNTSSKIIIGDGSTVGNITGVTAQNSDESASGSGNLSTTIRTGNGAVTGDISGSSVHGLHNGNLSSDIEIGDENHTGNISGSSMRNN